MTIEAVELRRIRMPLRSAFRTSFGTETERDVLLVRVVMDEAQGWGECVAMAQPLYSSEFTDGAHEVTRRFLVPMLFRAPTPRAADLAALWEPIQGHRMAKAAVEMAVLDAELRAASRSLADHLGAVRDRVECGVSIGIVGSVAELLDQVDGYLAEGYRRIKLKIEPGWDVEPVRAVRERFGDVLLQVDANAAYELSDAGRLAELDDFDLLMIEQPLAEDCVRDHAELAEQLHTPICLDESITSARAAADAVAIGACRIVNIKPGRMGGYLEAKRTHDLCASLDVPVWCGGMLESGIGRAANVALAALPNFTLPGDTSASGRYFELDVTPPFVLEEGCLTVPTGPGIGIEPRSDVLEEVTTSVETLRP